MAGTSSRSLTETNRKGWAYSIGLYKNFGHPEIVVFGLDLDLMHFIINAIGDAVKAGGKFEVDGRYGDLVDTYFCTFKPVEPIWYDAFLGYAEWFYDGTDYPVLQCIWPDKNHRYPWESDFNPHWVYAQPLLFHEDADQARVSDFLK